MSHISDLKFPQRVGDLLLKLNGPWDGTTADAIIAFMELGNNIALWVQIINHDGTNALEYSVNTVANLRTIPASGVQVLDKTPIETLYIYPDGATGDWEVSAQVAQYKDLV